MMARIVFLVILLAGAGLGIGYPLVLRNFSGSEIGSWRVYDRASGFMTAEAALSPADAPVRVMVDMVAIGAYAPSAAETALTITATGDGRTVLAETISFMDAQPRTQGPQVGASYRAEAGLLDPVAEGSYVFTVGPGDAEGIEMRSVDLILRSGAMEIDRRAIPAGYIVMAIGFIGLVNSFRRNHPPKRSEREPPPPKWGRG